MNQVYQPVEGFPSLLECAACGCLIKADGAGVDQHDLWHRKTRSSV